ncbi:MULTISPECIES: DUF3293 domain-containing protein [unclassified Pseudofrankia]|uniref:DUF3293 domain-containing protein n=1 Tax=unclassified Pseudofrankia TaxID=2994372 RepID=UPI0008DA328D|nr:MULTISPECIES: DUF3293 domain-containing protein [unclassified Pseudofrankia]MDT3443679.1 DUF3293 domain-containing protein [Pseudofrankia sp. BMG5.37]OHV42922.1 hypothetical protein BCD48_29460 [Pseudofrankia sp. BMG5.36]
MRPNPGRAELLALLGAQPGATAAAASRSYLDRRRDLLSHDPDWRRPEVARLDDAFGRLRAATDVERRLAGYRPTRVRVGVGAATVVVAPAARGTTEGDFPFSDVERVHVLTAFNPRSRPLRPHENASRQRALAGRVAATGLPSWPAVGGDEKNTELSIAVAGLTRARARALGAEFEQDAIFEWTPAAWSLVPCDELVTPRELGWRVSRTAAPLPDPLAARPRADASTTEAGAALETALAAEAEAAEAAAIARARDQAGDAPSAGTDPAEPGQPAVSPAGPATPSGGASPTGPTTPSGATPTSDAAPVSPADEPASPRPASAAKGDASTTPRDHGGGNE